MTTKRTAGGPGATRRERRAADRAARRGGAAPRTSGTGSGPSMGLISVAAVVVGLIAVLALVALGGGLGGNDVEAVSAPEEAPPAEHLRDGRSLGDPAAPVSIEVYEDPQCPACGTYSRQVEPLLLAPSGPVAAGEVRYTYRDLVFLGPESLDAAVAMRVAEDLDGGFWEFHQVLFHNQHGENEGAFSQDRLADMAELVGLDREAFLAGLADPRHAEAVRAESAEARERGVDSTPTLVIDGVVYPGVPSWDELSALIDEAVAGAGAAA